MNHYIVYSNWTGSMIQDSIHLTIESANQRVLELEQYGNYKSSIKDCTVKESKQ